MDKLQRPQNVPSQTWHDYVGHHRVSITVGFIGNKPMEVFMKTDVSHEGAVCERAWIEALARTISTGLRHGVPPEVYIEQLINITCVPEFRGNEDVALTIKSPADFLARVLTIVVGKDYIPPAYHKEHTK